MDPKWAKGKNAGAGCSEEGSCFSARRLHHRALRRAGRRLARADGSAFATAAPSRKRSRTHPHPFAKGAVEVDPKWTQSGPCLRRAFEVDPK